MWRGEELRPGQHSSLAAADLSGLVTTEIISHQILFPGNHLVGLQCSSHKTLRENKYRFHKGGVMQLFCMHLWKGWWETIINSLLLLRCQEQTIKPVQISKFNNYKDVRSALGLETSPNIKVDSCSMGGDQIKRSRKHCDQENTSSCPNSLLKLLFADLTLGVSLMWRRVSYFSFT